jgi:general secretion pathway protein K
MRRRSNKPGVRSEKGVALLMTLFAMTLLTFIAMEVGYDTQVDYIVARQQVDRIRAYYAAKSGVEISLIRVMLYKQISGALGNNPMVPKSMLDPIWSFPFMWPPTAMGGKMTEVDKSLLGDVIEESYMVGQYAATITPEGGRIDINDLGSPSKNLQKAMIQQLVKVFTSRLEHDEEFSDRHRGFKFEELVNNIADYIDDDKASLNGGDEGDPYRDIREPGVDMPPNRSLRTLDELHQVAGMTDEFYNMLSPRLTVYGTKGININYADKETLLALDKTMTNEAVDKLIARRSNVKEPGQGPFKSEQDLFSFLTPFSVDIKAIQESKVPLLFDQEFNFRISSTGVSGNVRREITAITYDFPSLAARFADIIQKQRDQDLGLTPGPGATGGTGGANQAKAAKGRPTVVSWEEN